MTRRQRTIDAFVRTEAPEGRKKRFSSCGSNCWVLADRSTRTQFRLSADYCHDRWCAPCTAARAATVAANLCSKIEPHVCRFLTLTYYTPVAGLRQTVSDLFAAFVRLRRSHEWRRHVKGGAAFLEAKWNSGPNRWHVHLHVLIEGTYFPHELIKRAWTTASVHSTVVDVRRLKSREHAVSYITKYCTKAIDNATTLIPDRFDEAIVALKGTRSMTTFGSWRKLRLTTPVDAGEWVVYGPLDEFLAEARRGSQDAIAVLSSIRSCLPWTTAHRLFQQTIHPPPSPSLFDFNDAPTVPCVVTNSRSEA